MPDYDAGFKIVARLAGKELAALAGVKCESFEPIEGEVQAATRFADRAFVARHNDERFVVYLEAYTRWEASAPWSVLAKSGLLSERERLPTVSLVFVLRRRGYKPQRGTLRLSVGRKPTQQVWFREICMWRVKPARSWIQWPGMLPLYPLCAHHRPGRDAVIVPAKAIDETVSDSVLRADLLTTLAIFGKLAYPGLNVLHLIGSEKMKESKFFEEVAELGAVEARRDAIACFAAARFGPDVKPALEEKLTRIDQSAPLIELTAAAAKCKSISELHHEIDLRIAAAEAGRRRRPTHST